MMKIRINSFLSFLFFVLASMLILVSCAGPRYSFYRISDSQIISFEEGIKELADSKIIILGEDHYQRKIQKGESFFIEELAKRLPKKDSIQLAWEFFQKEDQEKINHNFSLFKRGKIDREELLEGLIPKKSSYEFYFPLFDVVKKYDLDVIGINSSRRLKKKLMEKGVKVLKEDREIWPFKERFSKAPHFYWDRFFHIMQEHVKKETIEKYYLAQCYTDAYMANSMSKYASNGPIVMVMGHFHSDYYNHGFPFFIKKLGFKNITQVRLLDVENFTQGEIKKIFLPHYIYGPISDYILLMD